MRKVALGLFFLASAHCFGSSYYLSAKGDDSASGKSPYAAWKTIGRLNSTPLAAYDQINLRGGDTFPGTLYLTANMLSVKSYGSGRATIDAGSGDGIDIYDVAGASISGIEVKGGWNSVSQTGNTGSGIGAFCDLHGARKLKGLRVTSVNVHGFQQCGIVFGAYPSDGSQSGYSGVTISGCKVYSNGQAGIESYGYFDPKATTYAHSDVLVDHCTVYDNEGLVNGTIASGNGIVLGQIENATIQFCEAYGNGGLNRYPYAGPVGIWAWDSDHVTIQNCESHHNSSLTVDGDGFDLDGGTINSVMQYNYSHDNVGAGLLIAEYNDAKPLYNLTVRYNISQNDGSLNGGGLVLWSGGPLVHDCYLYNNTAFTSRGSPAVNIFSPVSNVYFRNNVIVSTNSFLVQAPPGQVNVLFQANDYWAGGGGFAINWNGSQVSSLNSWRSLGQESIGTAKTGLWADPGYLKLGGGTTIGDPSVLTRLTSYRLKLASPMVKAGLPMSNVGVNPGPRDFFGSALRRGTPDIGATQVPAVVPAWPRSDSTTHL